MAPCLNSEPLGQPFQNKEIKAVEVKQSPVKRNPEHYINRNETLLDPVTFNLEEKALNVPSMRLKGLPRFDPARSKPLANYLQMDDLVKEMQHIFVKRMHPNISFIYFFFNFKKAQFYVSKS